MCARARLCVNRNVSHPRTLTHQKWFTVVANSRERICVYTTTDMADPFQYSLMFSLSSVLINGCFLKVKVCLPSSFPHSDSISRLQLLLGSVARQLFIYYYGIWWSSTGKLTGQFEILLCTRFGVKLCIFMSQVCRFHCSAIYPFFLKASINFSISVVFISCLISFLFPFVMVCSFLNSLPSVQIVVFI